MSPVMSFDTASSNPASGHSHTQAIVQSVHAETKFSSLVPTQLGSLGFGSRLSAIVNRLGAGSHAELLFLDQGERVQPHSHEEASR